MARGRFIDFTYANYIASDDWKAKRQERLALDAHMCSNCDATTRLQVHHLTYERLGNERMNDLTTLCEDCHGRLHGRGPRVLAVLGDKTPRQRDDDRREEAEHSLLIAAKALEQAVEEFRIAARSAATSRHDGALDNLQWIAGDVFAEVQREVEATRYWRASKRSTRRKAA